MLVSAHSSGLGVIPLLPLGVAIGTAGAMLTWDPFLQLIGAKSAPALTPTPTVLTPPPAPITREALRTWTPAMLEEATAQRAEEQKETQQQIVATAPAVEPVSAGIPWMIWLALGLGAGAFALAVFRGGR